MSPTLPALEHATLCVQHAKQRATLRNGEESAQERPETAPPRPENRGRPGHEGTGRSRRVTASPTCAKYDGGRQRLAALNQRGWRRRRRAARRQTGARARTAMHEEGMNWEAGFERCLISELFCLDQSRPNLQKVHFKRQFA